MDLGTAANLAQIVSVVAPTIGLLWVYRRRMCKIWWCWRWGRHEVPGTTWKTCDTHLTAERQQQVYDKHAVKKPKQHDFLNGNSVGPP